MEDDECFTTSEFSKNNLEENDFCEDCIELLIQAQDRCHLGLIIFDPDLDVNSDSWIFFFIQDIYPIQILAVY